MADADLTEYERLRAENIRRNEVILASVRRKADELPGAIKASDPRSVLRRKTDELPAAIKASDPRSVLRRSLRLSQPPPDAQPTLPAPNPTPSRRRAPRKPKRRRRAPPRTTPGTAKPRSTTFSSSLASTILEAVSLSPGAAKLRADDFDAGKELVLTPANVRTLLPSRILGLLVLPLVDRTMVAAGDKLGNIGFWHADPELGVVEADGVFEYLPHRGPVAAIVAHPAMPHKIYSCSYKGEICLMDLEKENFNIIYSRYSPVISLCQAPDSASCLYVGDGSGELKLFDERMGKVSATWESHDNRINSVDFHPEKKHMLATSSTDRTTRIWDLRRLENKKENCLKVLEHSRSVQSAYFSPSGRMLATTSVEDTVQVFHGDDFDSLHISKHNNQTGTWLSTFKAIWGWNDTDLFIGNMKRAIDVISVGSSDGGISASNSVCVESEHMTVIPCRFSAHPYKVGHLACASSNGKVFLWTRA